MRRLGMAEIAKLANVSIGTVGRALSGRGRISEATRQRVLQVARELSYKPNLAARSLSVRKPYRIGVCIPQELHVFYDQVRGGILEEAARYEDFGISLVYRPVDRLGVGEAEKVKELIKSDIKALIVSPGDPKKLTPLINTVVQRGIPVICVNTDAPASKRSSIVCVDAELSGRLAGELMGRLVPPKSQIAIATGMLQTDTHYKTTRGFSQLLPQTCPGARISEVLEGHEDEDETFAKCMKLLRKSRNLAGIYVNTAYCLPVCRALTSVGLSGKVKLITTDLFREMLPYFEKGTIFASIYQCPYVQGQRAIRLAMDYLISGHPIPATSYTNPHIVMKSNLLLFHEMRETDQSSVERWGQDIARIENARSHGTD